MLAITKSTYKKKHLTRFPCRSSRREIKLEVAAITFILKTEKIFCGFKKNAVIFPN